jgi:hypothetical protein
MPHRELCSYGVWGSAPTARKQLIRRKVGEVDAKVRRLSARDAGLDAEVAPEPAQRLKRPYANRTGEIATAHMLAALQTCWQIAL